MAAMIRTFGLLTLLVFLTSLLANTAEAQMGRNLSRRLGILGGDGYHSATPLTRPSYYNPYSPLNSSYYTLPTLPTYPTTGWVTGRVANAYCPNQHQRTLPSPSLASQPGDTHRNHFGW